MSVAPGLLTAKCNRAATMKSAIRYILPLAALAAAASAVPFLAVGDSAELFVTASAGVSHDDNIFLSTAETEDVVYELSPGAELVVGKNGPSKARVDYKAHRYVFRDHAVLNRWDSSVVGSADYVSDDEATKLRFDAAYSRLSDNTFDLHPAGSTISRDSILRRRDIRGAALADIRVFETDSILVGGSYDYLRYQAPIGVDQRIVEAPLAYYFRVAPGDQLGLGFRFRNTLLSHGQGANSRDLFYFVGLRGKLSSNITGTVSVGYLQRDFDHAPGQGTVGVESSLSYTITENTQLVGEFSNDFGTSPTGLARREMHGSLGLVSQLNNDWSTSLKVGYTRAKYLGLQLSNADIPSNVRLASFLYSENWYEGTASLTYSYNTNLSLTAGYTYRRLLSRNSDQEFADNVFSFSIQLRY